MDADSEERQRDRTSRRETRRWSMNSQRLEQIVAELMRPIGDLRRSFDTDLSALLEEYLTEAGLHALEEGEQSPDGAGGAGAGAVPNFSELALLLQQSANIYGRKVDFLYQHVLEVSESLQLSTNELSNSTAESPSVATPASARRRRRGSGAVAPGWARIALEAAPGARREAELRPPPTLPRLYADLAPRVLAPCDAPLIDYAGEPVGLLQDFHVTWRLHGGMLVDELECGSAEATNAMRPIPLAELQAAIEAAAPPSPPPPEPEPEPEPPDDARIATSTPLPTDHKPPVPLTPSLAGDAAPRRKRRAPPSPAFGDAKLLITPELLVFLRSAREFGVRGEWVARVVAARRARLLRERTLAAGELKDFRGFDTPHDPDISDVGDGAEGADGADGADRAEARRTLAALARLVAREEGGEPEPDDGFFEQSEPGSEGSHLSTPPTPPTPPAVQVSEAAWAAWRAGVVARAAAAEARGLDVRELARAVLAALPAPPAPPAPRAVPFAHVLATTATDVADVSRLFLASLFLANAGNVEVVPGPALSLNSFSLRLVSDDESRYYAAATADPAFLTR